MFNGELSNKFTIPPVSFLLISKKHGFRGLIIIGSKDLHTICFKNKNEYNRWYFENFHFKFLNPDFLLKDEILLTFSVKRRTRIEENTVYEWNSESHKCSPRIYYHFNSWCETYTKKENFHEWKYPVYWYITRLSSKTKEKESYDPIYISEVRLRTLHWQIWTDPIQ